MFGQKLIKEQFKLFLIEIWLFIIFILLAIFIKILLPKSLFYMVSWILVLLWLVMIIKINIFWQKHLNKIAIEEDEK